MKGFDPNSSEGEGRGSFADFRSMCSDRARLVSRASAGGPAAVAAPDAAASAPAKGAAPAAAAPAPAPAPTPAAAAVCFAACPSTASGGGGADAGRSAAVRVSLESAGSLRLRMGGRGCAIGGRGAVAAG